MPLDLEHALGFRKTWPLVDIVPERCSLYALGLGFGSDPLDDRALDYVLETRGPKIVPTIATALARSLSADLGLNLEKVLHAGQQLELFRPIPASSRLKITSNVDGIADKGAAKGAVIAFSNHACLVETGEPVFRSTNVILARGDGGCGSGGAAPPSSPICPDRPPDILHSITTSPGQALLFRLNGDFNPLHSDPAAAIKSGFSRPILHGLATYGIAARALIEALDIGGGEISAFGARFSAIVYPGETILTSIWREAGGFAFRCRVPERDATVLDAGRCEIFGI